MVHRSEAKPKKENRSTEKNTDFWSDYNGICITTLDHLLDGLTLLVNRAQNRNEKPKKKKCFNAIQTISIGK